MKNRILSLILAIAMLCSCAAFASCSKSDDTDKDNTSDETSAKEEKVLDLHELYDAVNEKLPFDGLISTVLYKNTDIDEMIYWTYGVIEASCHEKITDYVITLPSDYNQSFAAIVFDDTITDEEIEEIKDVVGREYIKARASSLQMYMPEEYDIVKWQLENPDAIWRQYGNTLVLLMYGAEEASAGWDAIDALLK